MKKLLVILLLACSTVQARDIWRSSVTATTEDGVLCGQGKIGIYHGMCTNTAITSSSVTVSNSSYTITGVKTFGNRSTAISNGCYYYDTVTPKGLYYSKFGTADVSILYDCK